MEREKFARLGESLFEAFNQSTPRIPALQRSDNAGATVFWRANADTPRPDVITMDPSSVVAMREAHDAFIEKAQRIQLPYNSGRRGIVSTAGGIFLPVFVVSLRMLRRTGCDLSVELFLGNKDDYDQHLCDIVLPSMNARCVTLEDYLGENSRKLAGYQFKIFSILFSSFEDVLFLDADNILVEDPKTSFISEPFMSSGLVTWQDFWASSVSRHLYNIQNRPVPAMNVRASTESGQLLISKRSHSKALLVAAYYNIFGPGYYYDLLSQGGPGAGDKETFVAAAEAVGAPFYQVRKCVDTVGYYEDEKYHGVAMLQYDPTQDASKSDSAIDAEPPKPKPFAMHHNSKVDPVDLFNAEGAAINHATGESHRLWGPKNLTEERFGKDVEDEMWQEIKYVACDLGDKFRHWHAVPPTISQKGTCAMVEEYRAALF